tara:strand:+ start:935 stop:1468 length:534 start_codon:yes stop_codon:yes gene_type:complete
MVSPFFKQIENRNFLSPVGFEFTLGNYPKISFLCNSARIPEITLGTMEQPSYLKNIEIPGEKLEYGDLTLRFLVDENMENYMAVHNWLTGLGFPETPAEFKNQTTDDDGIRDMKEQFSDATLNVLNSNFRTSARVKFKDLFPTGLTSLEFDATEGDINYFTAESNFKYTLYTIDTNL